MALEEDIYEMYRDGPYDWFNPLDFMTSTLTGGPSGSWSEKTHQDFVRFMYRPHYIGMSLLCLPQCYPQL